MKQRGQSVSQPTSEPADNELTYLSRYRSLTPALSIKLPQTRLDTVCSDVHPMRRSLTTQAPRAASSRIHSQTAKVR